MRKNMEKMHQPMNTMMEQFEEMVKRMEELNDWK